MARIRKNIKSSTNKSKSEKNGITKDTIIVKKTSVPPPANLPDNNLPGPAPKDKSTKKNRAAAPKVKAQQPRKTGRFFNFFKLWEFLFLLFIYIDSHFRLGRFGACKFEI